MFESRRFVMVAATALAAIAATAVFMYEHGVRNAAHQGTQATVVVAAKDIPAGTLLGAGSDAVALRQVPKDDAVPGALSTQAELSGQRTAVPVLSGEQISQGMLQGSRTVEGGALSIPQGMVGETIPLDSFREAGGAVTAGDHVTVYATFEPTDRNRPSTTVTLVPDVQLLKVQAPSSSTSDSSSSTDLTLVTMALRPGDAQKLVYAQEEGSVWLALLPPHQQGKTNAPVTFAGIVR